MKQEPPMPADPNEYKIFDHLSWVGLYFVVTPDGKVVKKGLTWAGASEVKQQAELVAAAAIAAAIAAALATAPPATPPSLMALVRRMQTAPTPEFSDYEGDVIARRP